MSCPCCCCTFSLRLLSIVVEATECGSPASERGDVEEGGVARKPSSEHPGGASERLTGKEGEEVGFVQKELLLMG